jgi:hypothetical protein
MYEAQGNLDNYLMDMYFSVLCSCYRKLLEAQHLSQTHYKLKYKKCSVYEVVSKIFRTGAARYTAVVVARSTGSDRTTMSGESVCQVVRSWVDVGSYHMHLFGVVYVTCGDFHDGSEERTASVHQILCQSWEQCYADPHNDLTNLQGPNLESHTGVSMACPVQDRSHIS